jgi:predicted dehydrogenase
MGGASLSSATDRDDAIAPASDRTSTARHSEQQQVLSDSGRVRLAVIGLGQMGRHHARIASRLDGIDLIGGVDPRGDIYRSLAGHVWFADLEAVLAEGVDAAVVAVPSEYHEKVALRLADAGVHCLIEKPIATDSVAAMRVRDAFDASGLIAGVGHVERYNPALQEMKRRLNEGILGKLIAVETERVGPYPLRIRDVGVVQDLATHDIDVVLWLCGDIVEMSVQAANRLAGPHEDLIEVVGRLEDGAVFSMSVNWLTPTKRRRVTVLGERGSLVADLLNADLSFFSNGSVPTEWEEMARLKGVSEGDMIRYAIRKREPLQVELENFRDAVLGGDDAELVTLDHGVAIMEVADRMLEAAAGGRDPLEQGGALWT